MMREIVVESSPEETRVAILEGGKVAEIHVERAADRSLVGNVYLARVDRVIPGMQSAFVDIGLQRHAFLHVSDVLPFSDREAELGKGPDDEPTPKVSPEQPIEKLLRQGQEIVVQVTREPIGTKGARVTAHVTLPGKLVVYMPLSDHLGVSKRIADDSRRAALRDVVAAIRERIEGGVIVRTDAVTAAPEVIEAELAQLRAEWVALRSALPGVAPPKLLREDEGIAVRMLRDAQAADVSRIVTDDPQLHARMTAWLAVRCPELTERTHLHVAPSGLFESLGLDHEIDKALRDRAWLKSGGYLVINQLEALVAVDVNTGKFTGGKRLEDTILQVNVEAAREVARQLRLRDLGGIVIVDFIDMADPGHRQAVLDELVGALARDRARTTVLGMSEFGLVQITRQRQRRSLDRTLLETCSCCGGAGRVKSAETLANAALRRLRRQPGGRLTLTAHPDVARLVRERLQAAAAAGESLQVEVRDDAERPRDAVEIGS